MYYVRIDDFYYDLLTTPELLERMDTSNLPTEYPCFTFEHKKILRFYTDEKKDVPCT